jgi:L-fuculose-phosphate aldolase
MSAVTEAILRRTLLRYSHAMYQAGWVANHDGNLSARVNADRFVATPTAMSKIDVGLDDLIVVDAEGKQLAGARKPFSEMALHRAVYAARPEVGAVVHAHPPFATAYGVSGRALPHPFLPEAVVSLGAEVPTVPITAPGGPAVAALSPFVRRCDAVIIAGNGVLAWGPDLELAYLRLELVEHLARIAHAAHALGGPTPLPADLVADLVKKRRSAGLAAPEEGSPTGPSAASGGAHPSTIQAPAGIAQRVQAGLPQANASDVARIAAEVARAMAGR